MDLYINDYGTSIRKNGRMFEIASKFKRFADKKRK